MIRRAAVARLTLALLLVVGCVSPMMRGRSSKVRQLTLDPYVAPDGAITVFPGPNQLTVEPYFAMRALNIAADLGANIDSAARRYIAWELPRVMADGGFRRYCFHPPAWQACGGADADDAALALWIELLYRTASPGELPADWKRSVDASRKSLDALLDSTGVYLISASNRNALFMDGIEVLSALDVAANSRAAALAGDNAALARDADRIRAGIQRVFWDSTTQHYRVSTQWPAPGPRFYPEVVAQVYPAMFGYGNPAMSLEGLVNQWLAQHRQDWINEADSSAAWGLVAVAAVRAGRVPTATCWLGRAGKARPTRRWNVVDETIYRVLSNRLVLADTAAACRLDRPT